MLNNVSSSIYCILVILSLHFTENLFFAFVLPEHFEEAFCKQYTWNRRGELPKTKLKNIIV